MEFRITVIDVRSSPAGAYLVPVETDFSIIAESGHRVGELASALAREYDGGALPAGPGQAAVPPDLWLDGTRLDPLIPLGTSGIRDGARVGLGGSMPGASRPAWSGIAEIRVVAGPDAGLVVPVGAGTHTIARASGDVRLADKDVSREAHCVVTVSATATGLSCTVRDAESTNGTGLDGTPVGRQPAPVLPGQLIAAGHDLLTVVPPPGERAVIEPGGPDDPLGRRLSRPPRAHGSLPKPVVIDLAAGPARRERLPS